MATATLAINVSPEDLAKLKDLPAQIETIVKQSKDLLDSIRNGGNPENAFSGLLGNLSGLAEEANQIPELQEVLQPIKNLLQELPSGALADLNAITKLIDDVLGLFGPLKDALLSGKIGDALEGAVEKVLGDTGQLFQFNDDVTAALSGLKDFFSLFGSMLHWKDAAPKPEEIVQLLSLALIGIPHDALAEVSGHIESAFQPLAALLPDGPELTLWRVAPAARLALWQNINGRFAEGAVDWAALERDLYAELAAMLKVKAARDQVLSLTVGNLNQVNFKGLDAAHDAILKVPHFDPPQVSAFVDDLKNQMQGLVTTLETWEPTADEVRALVRGLGDTITDFVTQSPLGQLRALLVDFQQRILLAIESLPFRDLASLADEKLRAIAKALDVLDPDLIRKPVDEFFQKIEDKMQQFSADTVKNAVQQIWKTVEDALKQIEQLLEEVHTTIEGAIASLQNMVQQAQPALQEVSQTVDTIKTELDSFDLSQASSLVIDQLHKLKDTVANLDLSSLPGPAVAALKTGANVLKAINLSASINPPLNDALAKIDPTPIIKEAGAAIETVTGKLKLLDPASVVQQLDAPVNELLNAIGDFGPDRLQKLLQQALKPVEDAIRGLDIEHLFAPLTGLFAELSAKVNAILNPDLIFGPLEKAFQPVIDAIDKLEPNNLVHLLDPHVDKATAAANGGVRPPAAITGAGGALKTALQPALDTGDALFGFRPGDLLMPVIDLHHQIERSVAQLDDTILEPAARLLQEVLHNRFQALNPVNLQARLTTSLTAVRAEFDLGIVSSHFNEAEDAYQNAIVAIANAAKQQLSDADAATASRILTLLPSLVPISLAPSAEDSDGVVNATINLEGKLELSGMRSAFAGLADLGALLPSFLFDAEMTAASLRQAIHALDPAPVRVEINTLFDQLGHKFVSLQEALLAGLDELFSSVEDLVMPLSPGTIVLMASQLHAALKDQLLALSPSAFKDDIKLIFDVVKQPIAAFDPSFIVGELNVLRDQLIQTLEGIIADLLPDPAPFNALIAELQQFKPSTILSPITDALQPLSQLIATLDVNTLLQPLIDAIERIRGEVPQAIADIEAALDDVLSAFPDGGPANASGSVSVG